MKERFEAVLVGLALGDALGGPLEFMSSQQIQIKHGIVREMIGGGWLGLRPGAYTDDTQMMLLLAQSLVEKKGLDAADVARRYGEWLRSGPQDVGNITRASLEKVLDGVAVPEAARQAHEESGRQSAGNGALMRQAPLGLLYRGDAETLIRRSLEEARITHYDLKAGTGAALLNLCLARALAGAPGQEEKGTLVAGARAALDATDTEAYDPLTDFAGKDRMFLRPGTFVVDTLETALWMFLHTASFEECLVEAVNLGGDADTIGAVCGALAGAYYGPEALPERWRGALQDHGLIVKVARRLHALFERGDFT